MQRALPARGLPRLPLWLLRRRPAPPTAAPRPDTPAIRRALAALPPDVLRDILPDA